MKHPNCVQQYKSNQKTPQRTLFQFQMLILYYLYLQTVHCMRDHPHHAEPLTGGMWGAKVKYLQRLLPTNMSNMIFVMHGNIMENQNETSQDKKFLQHFVRIYKG